MPEDVTDVSFRGLGAPLEAARAEGGYLLTFKKLAAAGAEGSFHITAKVTGTQAGTMSFGIGSKELSVNVTARKEEKQTAVESMESKETDAESFESE